MQSAEKPSKLNHSCNKMPIHSKTFVIKGCTYPEPLTTQSIGISYVKDHGKQLKWFALSHYFISSVNIYITIFKVEPKPHTFTPMCGLVISHHIVHKGFYYTRILLSQNNWSFRNSFITCLNLCPAELHCFKLLNLVLKVSWTVKPLTPQDEKVCALHPWDAPWLVQQD